MENIKLPKVAICHGTPQFYGQYNPSYDKPDLMQVIEPAPQMLVDYLGDTLVICNSHQAQREWGFRRSEVIWHGFDPTELPPATYSAASCRRLGRWFVAAALPRPLPVQEGLRGLSTGVPAFGRCRSRILRYITATSSRRWKYRNYVDEIRPLLDLLQSDAALAYAARARRADDVRGGHG